MKYNMTEKSLLTDPHPIATVARKFVSEEISPAEAIEMVAKKAGIKDDKIIKGMIERNEPYVLNASTDIVVDEGRSVQAYRANAKRMGEDPKD